MRDVNTTSWIVKNFALKLLAYRRENWDFLEQTFRGGFKKFYSVNIIKPFWIILASIKTYCDFSWIIHRILFSCVSLIQATAVPGKDITLTLEYHLICHFNLLRSGWPFECEYRSIKPFWIHPTSLKRKFIFSKWYDQKLYMKFLLIPKIKLTVFWTNERIKVIVFWTTRSFKL